MSTTLPGNSGRRLRDMSQSTTPSVRMRLLDTELRIPYTTVALRRESALEDPTDKGTS